jgi:hypothetical protein
MKSSKKGILEAWTLLVWGDEEAPVKDLQISNTSNETGLKVLKNIQYQYQAGLKVLQKINTDTAGRFESVTKDPIPVTGWFESLRKTFNTNTTLI